MSLKINKDYILWSLRPGWNLFYLWWGLEPFWEFKGVKMRVFEFGIGPQSWELFKYKV